MGKKKPFIKKGEGVKFYLVHRSQKDPLYLDENLGERVLVPADPENHESQIVQAINNLNISSKKLSQSEKEELKQKRLTEQQKFGIYYEDDYDYLQHLREIDSEDKAELEKQELIKVGSVLIKDEKDENNNNSSKPKLQLPSSVFASKYEEEIGYFNQAAPDHDPKIDWDPDIVKILDEDPDVDYNDDLEDDFFVKANSGSAQKIEEEENDEDDYSSDNDSTGFYDQDQDSETQSMKEFETKSRFSNYSMTSSVIRRNAALTQLDEQFEKFFAQYDDEQIGALDTEDIDGFRSNDLVLEAAIQEFNKLMKKNLYENPDADKKKLKSKLGVLQEEPERDEDQIEEEEEDTLTESDEETEEENKSDNDKELVHFSRKKDKEERFDCESIISTYSTLYNHPALIKEEKSIKLSKKNGLPLGVFADKPKTQKEMDRIDHKITRILPEITKRDQHETKEEKKVRKQAVKEHRRERRIEKKINKLAFKEEKRNQFNQIKTTIDNANIVKLPL